MPKRPDIVSISLGAGVQSTTLYWMACAGEIEPRPDVAIFADTQSEPPWVYEHLAMLQAEGSIPIRVVTAGNLGEDCLHQREGRHQFAAIPVYVSSDGTTQLNWVTGDEDKTGEGQLRRQCTREYKIDPIKKEIRAMLGLQPRQRASGKFEVEEWVGISTDEAQRMKPSRYDWITSRWPLIEQGMSREDCKAWLKANGHPVPLKSACVFCPFQDDEKWAWMKAQRPDVFAQAVEFDREIRNGKLRGVREEAYLHRSLKPLDKVEFKKGRSGADLFGNECEGICGV